MTPGINMVPPEVVTLQQYREFEYTYIYTHIHKRLRNAQIGTFHDNFISP